MIEDLVRRAHDNACAKGFWDGRRVSDPLHVLAALMLITTEVAEAAEAVRLPDYGNLPEELADVCIRVFDLAGGLGIDLQREIEHKMNLNEGRPRLHGKMA